MKKNTTSKFLIGSWVSFYPFDIQTYEYQLDQMSWICVPILFIILGIATKRWDLTWIIFPLAIAATEIINVLKNK